MLSATQSIGGEANLKLSLELLARKLESDGQKEKARNVLLVLNKINAETAKKESSKKRLGINKFSRMFIRRGNGHSVPKRSGKAKNFSSVPSSPNPATNARKSTPTAGKSSTKTGFWKNMVEAGKVRYAQNKKAMELKMAKKLESKTKSHKDSKKLETTLKSK